jgi:hypothetical protein
MVTECRLDAVASGDRRAKPLCLLFIRLHHMSDDWPFLKGKCLEFTCALTEQMKLYLL